MEEIACHCSEGFGLSHSHRGPWWKVRRRYDGHEFRLPKYEDDPDDLDPGPELEIVGVEDGWMQMWVNWRAVVRALSASYHPA